jgi:hypothetical protein
MRPVSFEFGIAAEHHSVARPAFNPDELKPSGKFYPELVPALYEFSRKAYEKEN